MKTWHKVGIGLGVAAVLGGVVLYSINQANKGVVTVTNRKGSQTGFAGFRGNGIR